MTKSEDRQQVRQLVEWLVENYGDELLWIQEQGLVACYYDGEVFGKKWSPEIEEFFSREKVESRTHVCIFANMGGLYCKARVKITQINSECGSA